MLLEGRAKARAQGVEPNTRFVKADALDVSLEHRSFDSVLVGFFLSHVTDGQMDLFFHKIRNALKPGGRVVILDSNWTRFRGSRSKEGTTVRTLNDGRQFDIYKRYFEGADFVRLSESCKMDFTVQYEGKLYLVATGTVSQ